MIKCQVSTILTSQVMDCQVHAIGKATRPLFADPVTYTYDYLIYSLHDVIMSDC